MIIDVQPRRLEPSRRVLRTWIVVSLLLAARDSVLELRGGGVTPSWLLRAEIASLVMSAGLASVVLGLSEGARHARSRGATARALWIVGGVGAATRAVRLAIYLRKARAIAGR